MKSSPSIWNYVVKLRFPETATKIWKKNLPLVLTLLSTKCQNKWLIFSKGLGHKMTWSTFRDKLDHFSGWFFKAIQMAKPDFASLFSGKDPFVEKSGFAILMASNNQPALAYVFTYWEPKNILKCSSCHFMPQALLWSFHIVLTLSVKSTVKILSIFVAFLENTNFICQNLRKGEGSNASIPLSSAGYKLF